MKKLISVLCALLFIAGCSAAPAAAPTPSATPQPAVSNAAHGNFTDQMKLAYRDDLDPEAGAATMQIHLISLRLISTTRRIRIP